MFIEHCIRKEEIYSRDKNVAALAFYHKDHDDLEIPQVQRKVAWGISKFFPCSVDEQRAITLYLIEEREEHFFVQPLASRPQKIVTKELPISKDTDDIKKDLTEQGFTVEKVAQLTKAKTKTKLPILMVEFKKSTDFPDIFTLKKCCYLVVKVEQEINVCNQLIGNPMPGNSTDVYISKLTEALQERKTLVRQLKTLTPCIEPECPDHSSPPTQAEIDEINTIKLVQAAAALKKRKEKRN
ncbi:hypothetical protein TNIN_436781 [Trichonephila inaurata madagascariensis]|uniref:Pre-C2HC domain-containing protein n=1 Tax=Trichonephila inaurata madagascariensis TaxID=2747483 RepID=A0A8X7C040_9ARAC|nr:hypothetical protein TNIN_436781 [Trichonephila inaurata madagascariensis]